MSQRKAFESDQGVTPSSAPAVCERPGKSTINLQQLNLPLPQPVACVVCGAPFEIVRQRGRPQKFCSDDCRAAQHVKQKNAWSSQKRKSNDG